MKIKLNNNNYTIIDDEDFELFNQFKWFAHEERGRTYVISDTRRKGKRVVLYLHRILNGTPKHLITDHINGDTLDNRKSNLRSATNRQNTQNRHHNTTSKYPGVHYKKQTGRWCASIRIEGKKVHLGYTDTEEGAFNLYKQKCEEINEPIIFTKEIEYNEANENVKPGKVYTRTK